MARRKHPDDNQLLHLGDELRNLGCNPAAFLHRAVIGEMSSRSAKDWKRPAKVSPKTIAHGGPWVLYSPTLLHQIFRQRLVLTTSGGYPDYAPGDETGHPMRDEPHVKLLPAPSDDEIDKARYRLRAVGNALCGDLRDAMSERSRQVSKAMRLHAEIREELIRGSASVDAARAKVAKRHRVTAPALRRQIDRAKQHAKDLNWTGAFPALSTRGRRPR